MSQPSFALRLLRWCGRLLWSRRMAWKLVCLTSLMVLYYQWENWRSARELVAVQRRLVERLGTDDFASVLPPKIPDEQNYFAIPVIESWIQPERPGSLKVTYRPPFETLLPKDFISPAIKEGTDGTGGTLDLEGWASSLPVTDVKPPAALLAQKLGDGGGILPQLAVGLNRPFSMMKPGRREVWETSGGNIWKMAFASFEHFSDFQRALGLHLRSAALAGDQQKALDTALIMLRFSEAPSEHMVVGTLLALAGHGIAFDALHEAMGAEAWTQEGLIRLQERLSQFDDLANVWKAWRTEALTGSQAFSFVRNHYSKAAALNLMFRGESEQNQGWLPNALACAAPTGWFDANAAFYLELELIKLGPGDATSWRSGTERSERLKQKVRDEMWFPNAFRKAFVGVPMLGNIEAIAAETLFHRRCLIIGCSLERYRLQHGAFPATLDVLMPELAGFHVNDPAIPAKPLGYRQERQGYVLWSAGPDANDDGGAPGKDWLWRTRFSR